MGRASSRLGGARGPLGPFLHEIKEGINRGTELVGLHEACQRFAFERGRLGLGQGAVRRHDVQHLGWRRGGIGRFGFDDGAARSHGVRPARGNCRVGGIDGGGPFRCCARNNAASPGDRLRQEILRLEQRIRDAELEGFGAGQCAVVVQRVLDHHLHRILRPDQPRQKVHASPSGHQPQEGLGKCQRPGTRGHRAVGGLQGDFQAAAKCHAVDEGEAGNAQVGQHGVDLVAQLRHPQTVLTLLQLRDRGQICPGNEEVRLARYGYRRDLARSRPVAQLFEDGAEFNEGIGAKCRGLRRAQPVVQRNKGQDARAGVAFCGREFDVLHGGMSDGLIWKEIGKLAEICGAHSVGS
jgi:hypothetical protein